MNILSLENISKNYGIAPLFENVTFGIEEREEIEKAADEELEAIIKGLNEIIGAQQVIGRGEREQRISYGVVF